MLYCTYIVAMSGCLLVFRFVPTDNRLVALAEDVPNPDSISVMRLAMIRN